MLFNKKGIIIYKNKSYFFVEKEVFKSYNSRTLKKIIILDNFFLILGNFKKIRNNFKMVISEVTLKNKS